MQPLRVLFIAPYVPSLTRVRPFNLIKQIAARGHRVTLCAVSTSDTEGAQGRELGPYCESVEIVPMSRLESWWNCIQALPTSTPLQARYAYSPRLSARINGLLGRGNGFDVVHIEHLRAALLGWSVRTPHVFDAVDCISQLFAQTARLGAQIVSRWSARLDLPRTRRFERRLLRRFPRTLTTSEDQRAALVALLRDAGDPELDALAARITVLPNGVDLAYFRPIETSRDAERLVFVGRMSYHANISAAEFLVRDVLPRLWPQRPQLRLTVAGENPPARLRQLVAASAGRVTLTGSVPDVRPYVAGATIAVCPVTYAVGVQNKVLEALAMGTPVVCTPAGCRALSTVDGRELMVAPDAAAFADRILTLLNDGALRDRLGAAGRQYVETHHDWRARGEQLETIYREEIDRQGEAMRDEK